MTDFGIVANNLHGMNSYVTRWGWTQSNDFFIVGLELRFLRYAPAKVFANSPSTQTSVGRLFSNRSLMIPKLADDASLTNTILIP